MHGLDDTRGGICFFRLCTSLFIGFTKEYQSFFGFLDFKDVITSGKRLNITLRSTVSP